MGTELQRAGIGQGDCFESWNLLHPQIVKGIHERYVAAGAEVLLTNTFQANPQALARHGQGEHLQELFEAAIQLARQAAGKDGVVVADVGPCTDASLKTAGPILRAGSSADAFLLETLSTPREAWNFFKANRARLGPDKPILLSFAFCRQGKDRKLQTFKSIEPEACARQAQDMGACALGVNCGRDIGMDEIIEIVQRYRAAADLPLFARPNAGTPSQEGGCWVYPHTPGAMARRLPELFAAGLNMIGGCCGTTPEHIAAFARMASGAA